MADIFQRMTKSKRIEMLLRILTTLVLLYLFLVGVKTLSGGLKMYGSDFAKSLFDLTQNPVISLMAGIFATVLFQSSSVSTSIIVGLVAAGTIGVGNAVPMIMGANIGTSITNTIVSMGFIRNVQNFKRAIAAATVHDFFNILSVLILFPLEMATGIIEKLATGSAKFLYGSSSGLEFKSPIKAAVKPAVKVIKAFVVETFSPTMAATAMTILAGVIIMVALTLIVKTMNRLVSSHQRRFAEDFLSKNAYVSLGLGVVLTIAAQSSSITTSLLIPLAGSGLLSLRSIFSVTVGANIGTTATALLAAMTGNVAGLSIALVHLIFNLFATLIFFVPPAMREIPIWCAETLAMSVEKTRLLGIGYVVTVFIALPMSCLYFAS